MPLEYRLSSARSLALQIFSAFTLAFLALPFTFAQQTSSAKPPDDQQVRRRADALLKQMTLEEKNRPAQPDV